MTFVVVDPSEVVQEVEAVSPTGERGTFELRLKYLSISERRALLDRTRAEADGGEGLSDNDLVHCQVVGWNGLCDEGGIGLPFDTKNLHNVLELPYLRAAIVTVVVEELVGGLSAEKNSAAPRATGRAAV